MKIDIEVKNYRCFSDENPARFSLQSNSFTALVGVNNSGKSSLLKMFFELRELFGHISSPTRLLEQVRTGSMRSINMRSPMSDISEMFHNRNQRDISLIIKVDKSKDDGKAVRKLLVTIRRTDANYGVSFPDFPRDSLPSSTIKEESMQVNINQRIEYYSLKPLCKAMAAIPGLGMALGMKTSEAESRRVGKGWWMLRRLS